VENKWSPGESGETLISRYGYVNDELARRTGVVRTGTAFAGVSGDHYDLYGYNDRNELTGSRRFAGATIPDPLPEGDGLVPSFAYEYDRIGSRKTMKVCGAESCPPSGGQTTTYTRNALNQYTATSNPAESFAYDFDGNLTADGSFAYAWDAENRLVSVAPASWPVEGPRSS
jgi:hypothetical protein